MVVLMSPGSATVSAGGPGGGGKGGKGSPSGVVARNNKYRSVAVEELEDQVLLLIILQDQQVVQEELS